VKKREERFKNSERQVKSQKTLLSNLQNAQGINKFLPAKYKTNAEDFSKPKTLTCNCKYLRHAFLLVGLLNVLD
jgi:hypothetical protein